MNRLKTAIVSLFALFAIGSVMVPAVSYAATSTQTACSAITGNASCKDNSGGPSLNKIVKVIINILSVVVGVVAVIMVIIGGLRYITSGGDSNNVTSAKNTIIYALVGLVIVALAQFIVQFVLNKVTR